MSEFPRAAAHSPIEEVFPDIFRVQGLVFMMRGLVRITRNMTIVRNGGELTVFTPIRLDADGEAALEELGRVTHMVRIGYFHRQDDAWYAHRYAPQVWAPPRMDDDGVVTDHVLEVGCDLPLEGASFFQFERSLFPECAVLLPHEGGVLVTSDSVQNWVDFAGCDRIGRFLLWLFRFRGPSNIGRGWRRLCEPVPQPDLKGRIERPLYRILGFEGPWRSREEVRRLRTVGDGRGFAADFERLLERDFRHLLSGHGQPLRDIAKTALTDRVRRIYKPR